MRTKTLILTAMIGAASVVASLAQTSNAVYSVNVVGYVTLTVTNAGDYFRIICNPLVSTNTTLATLIPSAPNGARVFKLQASGLYISATWDPDLGFWDNEFPLAPGEGFFIKLQTQGDTCAITFVGEVAQNAASNKQLPVGLSLQGSLVPQEGTIDDPNTLNIPGPAGNRVFKLQANSVYDSATFDPDLGSWDKSLFIGVGEGFFYQNNSAAPVAWNRNFVVPQ